MEGQLPSGVPRIFMPADRVVASAVEKKIFKIAPAPRPGATTLPPMFLNPPSAARRVNYRYYVFIIIRYPVSPDRAEPNRTGLASPRREIINLSLQVPPRIYIHARTTRRSFRILRAVIRARLQIAALKLDANSNPFRSRTPIGKSSGGRANIPLMARSRDFVDILRIEEFFFSFVRRGVQSGVPFKQGNDLAR